MNKKSIGLLILNLLIVLGIFLQKTIGDKNKQRRLDTLLNQSQEQSVLGLALKSDNCTVKGSLPDSDCTPGGVFPLVSVEEICVPGYTKKVRKVSTATKKKVYEMYGFTFPQPRGEFEVDHLIPLALGGNNEIVNLWPEAADPKPGFKEKDVVEVYLHERVCKREIDLSAAQQQIARNWLEVYQVISMDEDQRIRKQYRNWAN